MSNSSADRLGIARCIPSARREASGLGPILLGVVHDGPGFDDIIWSATRRIVASRRAKASCSKYDRSNCKTPQKRFCSHCRTSPRLPVSRQSRNQVTSTSNYATAAKTRQAAAHGAYSDFGPCQKHGGSMLRRPLWGIHDGAEPTAGLATPALPQSRQVLTCAMAAVQKRLAQRDSHEIGLQAARTACLLVSASP